MAIEKTAPSSRHEQPIAVAELYALSAGHFTLPEKYFVHPASDTARRTVPSLAFLVQHHNASTGIKTRIVFDLGLRRDICGYSQEIQRHISTRQPLTTDPDVVKSLAAGGLSPDDIDYIIYSHVHWDHIGEPRDFPKSTFVIGSGSSKLFNPTLDSSLRGGHSSFEPGILPEDRTIELQDPEKSSTKDEPRDSGSPDFNASWTTLSDMNLRVLDLFHDGAVHIVDSPGHLPGHINLLVKTDIDSYTYLAGDACHDRRILRKEVKIGEWLDSDGHICCIHADRKKAEQTIERIHQLELKGVEVILAHDVEWEDNPQNKHRFWGV